MKEKIKDSKVQFAVLSILVLLFAVRGWLKTIALMTSPNPYMQFISIATIVVGTILVIGVSYFMLIKNKKIQQIYPLIGLTLGVLYILVIPTFATPDEAYHYSASYNVSNKILGVGHPSKQGDIYMRKCDTQYRNTSFQNGAYLEFGEMFSQNVDTELVSYKDLSRGDTSIGAYLIPGLGLTLGRLMKLNFPMTAMLGTLFNLLWFVLWMSYALKKIPFGNRILLTIILLPMSLQEISSFSRDNVLIVAATLIVALTLHWKYSGEKTKISEIIIFGCSSYVLITVKSALYAYLILYVVFILARKERFAGKNKKLLGIACAAIIVLTVVLLFPLHGWTRIYGILNAECYQAVTQTYGHSMWYYITHPAEVIKMIGQTLQVYGDIYILQLTGNGLGWLEVPNSVKSRVIYITLALLAVVRTQEDKVTLRFGTRLFSILFGIGGIFLCFFAMLLFWTPIDSYTIEGIQGRYFLPVLLPIFIGAGYWKKPVIKMNIDKYYPILLSGMGYVIALGVIRYNI